LFITEEQLEKFSYEFSVQEVKDLVLFLREHDNNLPDSLKNFSLLLHKHVYNSMTIDDAEQFFYESI